MIYILTFFKFTLLIIQPTNHILKYGKYVYDLIKEYKFQQQRNIDYVQSIVEKTNPMLLICNVSIIQPRIQNFTIIDSDSYTRDIAIINNQSAQANDKQFIVNVIKMSKDFQANFNFISKFTINLESCLGFRNQNRKIKVKYSSENSSIYLNSLEFSVETEKSQIQQNQDLDFMHEKIFQPYLVSNSMLLIYENRIDLKFSIKEIICEQNFQVDTLNAKQFENDKIKQSLHLGDQKIQLYFKVPNSLKMRRSSENSNFSQEKNSKSGDDQGNKQLFSSRSNSVDENYMMQQNKKKSKSNSKNKNQKMDIKDLHMDDDSQYYRFQLQSVQDCDNMNEHNIVLEINDITLIVRSQKKMSDKMYQDAIETNYSHEQMTPLNSIITNSQLIQDKLQDLIKYEEQSNFNKNKYSNDQTLSLLQHIQYSGKIMWYYNQNQIQRMKIRKGEFVKRFEMTTEPENYIKQAILQFSPFLQNRQINVIIFKNFEDEMANCFHGDWKSFSLGIFNLIQNSVKYNKFKGDIFILISLKQLKEEDKKELQIRQLDMKKQKSLKKRIFQENQSIDINKVLQVDVIDSGLGIERERQDYLFIPFLELKVKQNLKNVKNQTIGMGLACAFSIFNELDGRLQLLQSQPGRTVFRIQMPIMEEVNDRIKSSQQSECLKILFNYKRIISPKIQEYLISEIGQTKIQFQELSKIQFDINEYPFEENQQNLDQIQQKKDSQFKNLIQTQDIKIIWKSFEEKQMFDNQSETSFIISDAQDLVSSNLLDKNRKICQSQNIIEFDPCTESSQQAQNQQQIIQNKKKNEIQIQLQNKLQSSQCVNLETQQENKYLNKTLNKSIKIRKANQEKYLQALFPNKIKRKQSTYLKQLQLKKRQSQYFRKQNSLEQNIINKNSKQSSEINEQQNQQNIYLQRDSNFNMKRTLKVPLNISQTLNINKKQSNQISSSSSLIAFNPLNKLSFRANNIQNLHFSDLIENQQQNLKQRSVSNNIMLRQQIKRNQRNISNEKAKIFVKQAKEGMNIKKKKELKTKGKEIQNNLQILSHSIEMVGLNNLDNDSCKSVSSVENQESELFIESDNIQHLQKKSQSIGASNSQAQASIQVQIKNQDRLESQQFQQDLKNISEKLESKKESEKVSKQEFNDDNTKKKFFFDMMMNVNNSFTKKFDREESSDKIEIKRRGPVVVTNLNLDSSYSGKLSNYIDELVENSQSYFYKHQQRQLDDDLDDEESYQKVDLKKRKVKKSSSMDKKYFKSDIIEIENLENDQLDQKQIQEIKQNSSQIQNKKFIQIPNQRISVSLNKVQLKESKSQQLSINCNILKQSIQSNSKNNSQKLSKSGKKKSDGANSMQSANIVSPSCIDLTDMLGNVAKLRGQIDSKMLQNNNLKIGMYICSSGSDEFEDEEDPQMYDECNFQLINKFNQEDYFQIEEIQEAEQNDEISQLLSKSQEQGSNSQKQFIRAISSSSQLKIINNLEQPIQQRSKVSQSSNQVNIIKRKIIQDEQNNEVNSMNQEEQQNNSINSHILSKNSKEFQKGKSIFSKRRFLEQISKTPKAQLNKPKSLKDIELLGFKNILSNISLEQKFHNQSQKVSLKKLSSQQKQAISGNISSSKLLQQSIVKIQSILQNSKDPDALQGILKELINSNSQRNESVVRSQIQKCQCVPKIMLVDDNDFNLMPLNMLITNLFQINTELAFDGSQAVTLFKENYDKPCKCDNRAFKFIFMDLNMPQMDGYEASEKILKILKDDNNLDYCHIVALTSYTGMDVRQRCLSIGMKDMINKPLNSKDLQKIVYLHFYRLTLEQFKIKFPNLS